MLEMLIVPGRFLILYQLKGVVGYPRFFCLRRNLWEGVSGCFSYGVCDGVSLSGRLSVPDFDEIKEVGVVSVMQ